MAHHAENVARSFSLSHITANLPWGQHGLPPRPEPGEKIEGTARMMRYNIIFEQLKNLDAGAVALGHHLDDQVETMLMRLGRGAGMYGLAAMRPCRRWGMGSDFQYGLEGLSKWIIRPLLSFSKVGNVLFVPRSSWLRIVFKVRILDTCIENNIPYVEDPTNFQPEITLRNAIRCIVGGERQNHRHVSDEKQFPQEVVQGLTTIQNAARISKLNFSLDTPLDLLRQESNHIFAVVREQEAEGKCIYLNCSRCIPLPYPFSGRNNFEMSASVATRHFHDFCRRPGQSRLPRHQRLATLSYNPLRVSRSLG